MKRDITLVVAIVLGSLLFVFVTVEIMLRVIGLECP